MRVRPEMTLLWHKPLRFSFKCQLVSIMALSSFIPKMQGPLCQTRSPPASLSFKGQVIEYTTMYLVWKMLNSDFTSELLKFGEQAGIVLTSQHFMIFVSHWKSGSMEEICEMRDWDRLFHLTLTRHVWRHIWVVSPCLGKEWHSIPRPELSTGRPQYRHTSQGKFDLGGKTQWGNHLECIARYNYTQNKNTYYTWILLMYTKERNFETFMVYFGWQNKQR